MRHAGLVAAIHLALLAATPADAAPFDVQLLRPAPDLADPYFVMASPHPEEVGQFSLGTFIDFAKNPLVLTGTDGSRIASIVERQLTAHLAGSFTFHERLTLGAVMPVVLDQAGESVDFVPAAPEAGFGAGDLRLVPRVILYADDAGGRGFAVAIDGDIFIPSGSRDSYQGEGFRIAPRVNAELVFESGLRTGASVGYAVRPESEMLNLTVNDMVTFNVGAAYPLAESVSLSTELHGGVSVLAEELASEEAPMEVLAGLKHRPVPYVTLLAGGGLGIIQGAGAPDWRVFVGAALNGQREVVLDSDGDGLLDPIDSCPAEPEDKDGFEDHEGCPDLDNDKDGVVDTAEDCDNDPEDKDEFEDTDGCPDPDNDRDGLLDVRDSCANDPEDNDGIADEDGCPETDADADTIADVVDKCPLAPEVLNGFEDADGCPDEGGKVLVTCAKVEIKEKVFFDTGKSTIQSRSFALLDEVAAVLKQAIHIKRLRIEGHTDDRGNDSFNLTLSQARASAVREYLIAKAVDASRLEAEGFGEKRPISSNSSARGREQNRRVEFFIAEQDENPNCAPDPGSSTPPAGP
jgi:large repetitive protein